MMYILYEYNHIILIPKCIKNVHIIVHFKMKNFKKVKPYLKSILHTVFFVTPIYVHRKGNAGIRDQHLWGFPLFRPLDGKRSLSNASTAVENETFDAGVTKNYNINTRLGWSLNNNLNFKLYIRSIHSILRPTREYPRFAHAHDWRRSWVGPIA